MSAPAGTADSPIHRLPGVGPKFAEKLAAAGLHTLQDLWFHLPLRYEDRTRLVPVSALQHGRAAQIDGRVAEVERSFRRRPQLRVAISDAAGDVLVLRFFHFRGSQAAQFRTGARIRVYGEPRHSLLGWEMVHPSYRLLAEDAEPPMAERLDPVYPAVVGIGPQMLARLIGLALDALEGEAQLDLLPPDWFEVARGWALRRALQYVHRPPPDADLGALALGQHPAQQRLVIEELLAHHLSLRRQRDALQQRGAPALRRRGELAQRLRDALPFKLTGAQQRVLGEVEADLRQARPMLRLVQGDVGSGKTVVAALAALRAVENGAQVALVAPTELLAEQHFQAFSAWLEPLGVRVGWLAGKVTGKARQGVLCEIAEGTLPVVVGTHALMQQAVRFHKLALCIIDEQHRFGVHQRLALRDKGLEGRRIPHQLVMTATPIPRTLAMTAYADLDVSRIDELPPGRTPVRTVVLANARREEIIQRIREACLAGAQAYWVCTLIEDSDEVQAQAAESTFALLQVALPDLSVGLVHGRLKPAEKAEVMRQFKAGDLQLLVATTVIEVGVDVPNASLMLIENAERLGLAQLHQLRGRVGRGAAVSSCVLLYQPPLSGLARQRLETMRETGDGFVIAERDLALRGPGEMLGTRQTGLAQFRLADLQRDAPLLDAVAALGERVQAERPEATDALIRRWIGSAVRYAGV
ncbi:ATP-dependent DNA helicase RecG [Lysobacter sp. CAU 1642]|uniref:ATP-dependent DNA helicase RecG n=1 Tax=Pseudomarimonas salicorniae TaxID=2933270 RepID=A0ABT0GJ34_9GAMM|nr:ATP-dependent DNA helicase RecG [Lysobacter sp. CAU 1642]